MNSLEIASYVRGGLPPALATKYRINGDHLESLDGKVYVPTNEKDAIIAAFLKDPATMGGRDRLYGHLRQKYANITRREVAAHLANDPTHQIHRPLPRRVTTRAIIPSGVGKIAQIDLVDMSNYSGHNNRVHYILTYIDAFSKWVAAQPLPNKYQSTVVEGLREILDRMPPSWRPKTIQSDNGSEFQTKMNAMLDANHIKHVYSQAYNPTSQGIIERFNRTLKAAILEHFTRNNTKRFIDILDKLIDNFNNTIHGTTNYTPLELMEAAPTPELIEYVQERMRRRAGQNSAVENPVTYKVGDYVRVAVTTESHVRREKFRKKIGANWSSTVFQIYSISEPSASGAQQQYLLRNMDTGRKSKKRYWAYQLLKTVYDPAAVAEAKEQEEAALAEEPVAEAAAAAAAPAVRERSRRAREPSAAALENIAREAERYRWQQWPHH